MKSHPLNQASKPGIEGKPSLLATLFLTIIAIFSFSDAIASDYKSLIDRYGNPALARRMLMNSNSTAITKAKRSVISSIHRQDIDSNELKISLAVTVTADVSSPYSVTDLGTLGGNESFGYAINNSGTMIGLANTTGDTTTHPFLYRRGRMTDLANALETAEDINGRSQIVGGKTVNNVFVPALYDYNTNKVTTLGSLGGITPYNFSGTAMSVNFFGNVVGYSYLDSDNRHAFLYSNGLMKDIGSFGGYSSATGINNWGIIAGFSSNDVFGRAHAFIYENGVMEDINPLNDPSFTKLESYARDINDLKQVVGEYLMADQKTFQSFIYRNGGFIKFGYPKSPFTSALGINNRADVVGVTDVPYQTTCFDPRRTPPTFPCTKYKQHAFLYKNGIVTDLNSQIPANSDWELSWAESINDKGEIAGYGLKDGKFRAFVLKPKKYW